MQFSCLFDSHFRLLLSLSILMALPLTASAAEDAESDQLPFLLIVGTAHFNNPGRDLINSEFEDVMSVEMQAEIMEFLELLTSFSPTHVAVEFAASAQPQIDEAYGAYLDNNFELTNREQHQLGYRLGKNLGLSRVFGVDWNRNPPGDVDAYDWITFGRENGMAEEIAALSDPDNPDRPNPVDMAGQSITDWLLRINSPEYLERMHRVYFDIAAISAEDKHPGADWVGTWYGRNLKILNNLRAIATNGDERIVVFYGLGHAFLLNQLARESGFFNVETLSSLQF